jgi:ankyrin repeat protein
MMARDMSGFLERVELGQLEEVKSMQMKGEASITEVDEWGTTALVVAALNNKFPMARFLLTEGGGVQLSPRPTCTAGPLS